MSNFEEIKKAINAFMDINGHYPKAYIVNTKWLSKYLDDVKSNENYHSIIPFKIDNRQTETFILEK